MGFDCHRFFWSVIWKLNIPPKVHIFVRRNGHDLLSTNMKIASIIHTFNHSFSRFNGVEETLIHTLRDCSKTRDVLTHGGFNDRLLNSNWSSDIG